MNTQIKAYPLKHLIVMTVTGKLRLIASKAALRSLAADPDFNARCEVLLDLRDIECAMSVTDIFDLAVYMGSRNPALPTNKKIAVLVAGQSAFDHAQFFEVCAENSGLKIRAFEDYKDADEWLDAGLPDDSKDIVPALKARPVNLEMPPLLFPPAANLAQS